VKTFTDEQIKEVEEIRALFKRGNRLNGLCTPECLEEMVRNLLSIIDEVK
jgi:hypothetical protein